MNTRSLFNRLSRVFRVVLLAGVVTLFAGSMIETSMAQDAPVGEAAAAPKGESKSMMDTLKQGGWVMWPIGAASVLTIYLFIDVMLRTSNNRMSPPEEVEKAQQLFMAGDYVNAYQVMKSTVAPFNNCVKYGLSFVGKGKEQTEEALLVEVGRENARMQNKINYLSVIGVCTPMIGLVGTVVGMMDAFGSLGQSGAGDTAALSNAIGHVLVATASGLIVAIPAFTFFYILRNRLLAKMHVLEDTVLSLFRNMPYEHFHGLEIGEEVTYAALPNWVNEGQPAA
ncbi:MotA/TolQ/ExbB proton channel family protein [Luteolibacter flavescens]|uniref:MotA/TolQ/ExbB proton channel family protein n=1 Tax=Luteolibacter flavescens TaxID=1859460 RepID=A0ABT3FNC5_9BACT|nr:MotA/TolQ/ExbB proton channel family protein [Luteolibacter flavescens]MCW1885075.1 MotA/TolQ/ExbB proton channel family protein [Luteolibacter flavescens]